MSNRLQDADGTRTPVEAGANINLRTVFEGWMKDVFIAEMADKGIVATINDSGIDNTGKLILDEELKDGDDISGADWRVVGTYQGKPIDSHIEVMYHPISNYKNGNLFTTNAIKETKLKTRVARQEPILIMRDTYYYRIPWQASEYLLNTWDISPFAGMGWKDCAVIGEQGMKQLISQKLITQHHWGKSAMDIIRLRTLFPGDGVGWVAKFMVGRSGDGFVKL